MSRRQLVFEYNGNDILVLDTANQTFAEIEQEVTSLTKDRECSLSDITMRLADA